MSEPVPLIDLDPMHDALHEELVAVMEEVLRSRRFIGGEHVAAFERQIAEFLGTRHAVGVSSGTDALLVSLMALGVGAGDEVITTPFTFFATAGVIARLGATPVFVDIDPETFQLDVSDVEGAITERTRAILPVHLFGSMVDMERLVEVARASQLPIVEDAAQALGARLQGRAAGSWAELGCFSFFPTKNLGAAGDGGLVVTDDDALAERVRVLARHGASPKYHHALVGGNFRLDALQAALLSVKLPHLPRWNAERRRLARHYDEGLAGIEGVQTPAWPEGQEVIVHHYCVRVRERERVKVELAERGIGTGVYYPVPLHRQECFRGLGYEEGDRPHAECASREILALPMFPGLTESQQQRVVESLRALAG